MGDGRAGTAGLRLLSNMQNTVVSLGAHALVMIMLKVHRLGFRALYLNFFNLDLLPVSKHVDFVEINTAVCQDFNSKFWFLLLKSFKGICD